MEMKGGLIPDMSASQTIRDLVSLDVAKELIFTGKIMNGGEAARLKLVTRVCEKTHEEAMILAKEIASKTQVLCVRPKSFYTKSGMGIRPGDYCWNLN